MKSQRNRTNILIGLMMFGLMILLIVIGPPSSAATPVTIINPGFEDPALPDGGVSTFLTGWTITGAGAGAYNPPTTSFTGEAPEGQNVAFSNGPTISQTLTAALQANTLYRLRVEVGNRYDLPGFPGYDIELRAGGTLLVADNNSLSPAEDQFLTSTISFFAPSGHPQLGQTLEIRLLSRGIQVNFDNVRLDATSCTPPPSGMISWWPGDGNAFDIADNNDGTPDGATFAIGKVGQAFSFDGNDVVNVPFASNLNLRDAITIDAWINPSSSSGARVIAGRPESYQIFLNDDGTVRWAVVTGGTFKIVDSISVIPDGIFSHLAGTYDSASGELKVYVNGVLENTVSTSGTMDSNGRGLDIGAFKQGPYDGAYFQGLIDEVEVLDRALSAAEILDIVNADSAGKCRTCTPMPSNLVSWWKAENNANDNKDSNDGTLENGTTFASGKVGQAFSLDGMDDYVEVGSPASLNMTGNQVTLDGWINPSVPMSSEAWFFGKVGEGATQYALQWESDFLVGRINNIPIQASFTPPAATWTHLALVYDGSATTRLTIYVNGTVLVTSNTPTGNINCCSSSPFRIGAFSDGTRNFGGLVDEVEVFDRALSQTEIRAIVNAGSAGKCDDGDGVPFDTDNCPTVSNQDQTDTDNDGIGNACDACPNDATNDADGDGVCGGVDNCPTVANLGQENSDGDALGDACDACPNDPANDADGDGVCGNVDNCPTVANSNQADADNDGIGDVCDTCTDTDGDGFHDASLPAGSPAQTCAFDNCPLTHNPLQTDSDGDGIGDACDASIVFTSTRDGNAEIYLMNLDGSNQRRLTNHSTSDTDPDLSPDGSKVVFESNRNGMDDIYVVSTSGAGVPVATRLTTNSADDSDPLWSPDGAKIAFVSKRNGNEEIYVMNANGSSQTRLTSNSASDVNPVWSPNGLKVAFVSKRNGNNEIYVMNANGSSQTRLTNNSASDTSPVWSPDGAKIAFVSNRNGNKEIYVMNATNGSGLVRLTNNSATDENPAWSPNGAKIAFVSNRNGNDEIYVMDSGGSNQMRLTNDPEEDEHPVWSPDGAKIVFESERSDNDEIFSMNADGTLQTNLTNNLKDDKDPSF